MNLALIVNTTLVNSYTALKFSKAALKLRHKITTIFFYREGVNVANQYIDLPSDEVSLQKIWQDLAKEYSIPLIVCSASALRRGIPTDKLANEFTIGSLGQLIETLECSDRVVTFK